MVAQDFWALMAMLFRKKTTYSIISKAYLSQGHATHLDPDWLTEILFELCKGKPVTYSLNFGKERDIASLPDALKKVSLENLEDLDCSDESGIVFSFGAAGRAFEGAGTRVFQSIVVSGPNAQFDAQTGLFSSFERVLELHYGYGGWLSDDFSPVSERKIKKGFFGSTTAEIGPVEHDWLDHPSRVSSGAVKGIYPLNFWKESSLVRLQQLGLKLPEYVMKEGVVRFGLDALRKIAANNPARARFVHADWVMPE
jgi:hypothetical protein